MKRKASVTDFMQTMAKITADPSFARECAEAGIVRGREPNKQDMDKVTSIITRRMEARLGPGYDACMQDCEIGLSPALQRGIDRANRRG